MPNCGKCSVELTDENWKAYRQKARSHVCTPCSNKVALAYWHANKKKLAPKHKEWAKKTREERNAYQREWRLTQNK